jgi:short-subunit dehydrogenase
MLARTHAGLVETERLVRDVGGACTAYVADLTDAASLREVAEAVSADGRALDLLIHNAADVTSKPFAETDLEEIARQVQANVTGPLQLTRLLLPNLQRSPAAAIVTISSLAGYKPNPAQTVYSITKTAVNGMAAALRAEFGDAMQVMNVGLSSVGTMERTEPGQTPVAVFASSLVSALERGDTELFLSERSKWLMRLYALYPPLSRLK